jgi:Domain of unknown function (DUF4349)
MSSPDVIDQRFDELVHELRSGAVVAGPVLRERVRSIARREPDPPLRARVRRRRTLLVLAPVAALAGLAIALGVLSSNGGGNQAERIADRAVRKQPATSPLALKDSASTPAPSGSRLQLYAVEMQLRVSGLSEATKRALNLTRSFGGYVRSVQYGSGPKEGTAYLVLRVPIGKVQRAVVKLQALGTILDQHVSIQDVQPQADARFRAIQKLRTLIASLEEKLATPGLSAGQQAGLEARVALEQTRLDGLRRQQKLAATRASFATVSLDLRTKKAAVAVPAKPGRIGHALDSIWNVLVIEAEILLYVVLIAAPFLLLAALAWAARRSVRRRSEEQLLAR